MPLQCGQCQADLPTTRRQPRDLHKGFVGLGVGLVLLGESGSGQLLERANHRLRDDREARCDPLGPVQRLVDDLVTARQLAPSALPWITRTRIVRLSMPPCGIRVLSLTQLPGEGTAPASAAGVRCTMTRLA